MGPTGPGWSCWASERAAGGETMRGTAMGPPFSSGRVDDLVLRFEAARTHADATGGPVDHRAHALQVRVPAAGRPFVLRADVVPGAWGPSPQVAKSRPGPHSPANKRAPNLNPIPPRGHPPQPPLV